MDPGRQHRIVVLQVIVEAAKIIIMDSSDEDEEVLEKVDCFAEVTVPNMNDKQFKAHFRMHPETFESLLTKINVINNAEIPVHKGFPRTESDKELLIAIWYLSNMESLRSVADRFGVSKSTCWSILYRMCHLLLQVNRRWNIISWPTRERQQQIQQHFSRLAHGFPGIIGCIDGSHIEIVAPKENHVSYINRKNYHSILLQGVCDQDKRFIDVYVGEAGSLHDYTLYRRSDLYSAIQNNEVQFHNDGHLVGDLAYKLDSNLIVGFKNNGRLTPRQSNFNKILSKARVTIENSFALLKGRFRRLKYMETIRLDLVSLLVMAACILHNICLENGDDLDDLDVENERREEAERNPRNLWELERMQDPNEAIIKRNNIVNALPMLR